MHVLQVHNHYRLPGGEDLVVERDTEALRDSGHQVTIYDTTNAVSAPSAIASLAIAPWNTVEASRLVEAVSRAQPDVVHFHNTWFRLSPSTIKAVSDLGVPTVMTLHNYRILCVNGQRLRNGRTCDSCLTDGKRSALQHRCYQGSLPLSAIAVATRGTADRKQIWSRHIDRFIAMTPLTVDLFERWGFSRAKMVVRPHHLRDPRNAHE